jgi:hypothetical protein
MMSWKGSKKRIKKPWLFYRAVAKSGRVGVKGAISPLAQREVSSQNLFFHVSLAAAGGKKNVATALGFSSRYLDHHAKRW